MRGGRVSDSGAGPTCLEPRVAPEPDQAAGAGRSELPMPIGALLYKSPVMRDGEHL